AVLVARNVRVVSGEPTLRLSHEHRAVHLADVVGPLPLGLRRGLEARDASLAHVLHEGSDPAAADLDRAREVGRGRVALRSTEHQAVRVAVNGGSEERARAVLPLVEEPGAADAPDVDPVVASGDGVEAGRIDDDVEVEMAVGRLDARLRDALDR